MKWVFINSGRHNGHENMAFDIAMASRLQSGEAAPCVRVYGWAPPAISIGFNQDPSVFDASALRAAGIDLVRRPTGGRAILHDNELTYSLAVPIDIRGPRGIYRAVNECLLAALRSVGIDASLTSAEPDFRKLYADPASIPCFSVSARDEIQFGGKKLVGSAQRRFGNVILQHGSILLGPQHRDLARYLAGDPGHDIAAALEEHTIDAATILGREVPFGEMASAVRTGFEQAWNIVFTEEEHMAAAPVPA